MSSAELNKAGEPVVLTEVVGEHILIATINRPEVRNCINGAVANAIDAAVKRVEADDTLWVGILAGAGDKAFCAGADLSEISAGRSHLLSTTDGGFAGFTRHKRKKPWIAAVRGVAMGGGTELALSSDMIVAGEGVRFGLPEVKRGLFAGAGGPFRLPRAIPRHIAFEMIATGDPITAQRAYELGLVGHVVVDEAVRGEAIKLAESIVANAPVAVRESLAVARIAAERREDELWTISGETRSLVYSTDDAKEGPRAFLEKRPPRWTGR